ncbi:hypothetical protein GPECTOR_106g116 [Gonium pectorale]|uniref:Uncharacterized protein n=1 Tax=Gonium pectorale TaxID=33097 RepID=A0A150FZK0_GONPE|nr:hypothetical protein GPECTOR_106g116 [Gonium pectorale]|eukprot:KXZ43022.1 hypothetical protein GPECTOR_106g116 [Gonium pectorale]
MALVKSALTGDVTALLFARLGPHRDCTVLFAGCGPQLLVYRLHGGGQLLAVHRVLDGCRIHGVAVTPAHGAAPAADSDAGGWGRSRDGDDAAAWVAVYGDRWPVPRAYEHDTAPNEPSPAPAAEAQAQPHEPPADQPQLLLLLALALADNSVEVWRLRGPPPSAQAGSKQPPPPPQGPPEDAQQQRQQQQTQPAGAGRLCLLEACCVLVGRCGTRGQLFSAAVLPLPHPRTGELRLWVAAGTMFNEVLLWRLPPLPPLPHDLQAPRSRHATTQPPPPLTASTPPSLSGGAPPPAPDRGTGCHLPEAPGMGADSSPAPPDWPQCVMAEPGRLQRLAARYADLEARLRGTEARLAPCSATPREVAGPPSASALSLFPAGSGLPAAGSSQQGCAAPASSLPQPPPYPPPTESWGPEAHGPAAQRAPARRRGPLRVLCAVRHVLRGHEGSVFHVEWLPAAQQPAAAAAAPGPSAASPPVEAPTAEVGAGPAMIGGGAGSAAASTTGADVVGVAGGGAPRAPGLGGGSGGWMLATTSDDRSARLWALPDLGEGALTAAAPAAPAAASGGGGGVGTGTGRRSCGGADVVAARSSSSSSSSSSASSSAAAAASGAASNGGAGGGLGRLLLVTGSEDCSARVWEAGSGRCLAVLQGHRGRGIWRSALLAEEGLLATAGADGVIRIWALREWAGGLLGAPPAPAPAGAHRGVRPIGMLAGAGNSGPQRSPGLTSAGAVAPGAAEGGPASQHRLRLPLPPAPEALCRGGGCDARGRAAGDAAGSAGGGEGVRCLALQRGGRFLLAGGYSGCVHRLCLEHMQQEHVRELAGESSEAAPAPAKPHSTRGAGAGVEEVAPVGGSQQERRDGFASAAAAPSAAWELLYGDSAAGAVTCLEACPLPLGQWGAVAGGSFGGSCDGGGDGPAAGGGAASSGGAGAAGALVAAGHNSGQVAVLWVPTPDVDGGDSGTGGGGGEAMPLCSWRATGTGAVIGAWWAEALGPGVLLTVGGDAPAVRLWRLPPPPQPQPQPPGTQVTHGSPRLLAVARSPLRGRLLVADVCPVRRALLAGDQHGNLLAFAFPRDAWDAVAAAAGEDPAAAAATAATAPPASAEGPSPHELPCVASSHGALGPAAASWVRLQPGAGPGVFCVAGRDGLMATYRYRYHTPHDTDAAAGAATGAGNGGGAARAGVLECLGSSSRTGVASIEAVLHWPPPPPHAASASSTSASASAGCTLVAGFRGPELLLVGLSPDPAELLRLPGCGGWRRTHALAVEGPDHLTFAHVEGGGGGGGGSGNSGGGGNGSRSGGSIVVVARRSRGSAVAALAPTAAAAAVWAAALLRRNDEGAATTERAAPAAAEEPEEEEEEDAPPAVSSRWLSTRPPRQGLRPRSLRVAQPAPSGDRRYLALALLGIGRWPPALPPCDQTSAPAADAAPSSSSSSSSSRTFAAPAAAAAAPAAPTALLAVSSSDATASLLTWCLASRCWATVARLGCHRHPVLALAHLPDDGDDRSAGGERDGEGRGGGSGCGGYWLVSGDTAGDVAVWWLPAWLHGVGAQGGGGAAATNGLASASARCADAGPGGGSGGGGGARDDGRVLTLTPALVVRRVHQSGVNALAVGWAPPAPGGGGECRSRSLVVVSGGDDQALAVLHLRLHARRSTSAGPCGGGAAEAPAAAAAATERWDPQLVGAAVRPLAHASALRGVVLLSGGGGDDGGGRAGSGSRQHSPLATPAGPSGGDAATAPTPAAAAEEVAAAVAPHVSSVGLDQALRLWRLERAAPAGGRGEPADGVASRQRPAGAVPTAATATPPYRRGGGGGCVLSIERRAAAQAGPHAVAEVAEVELVRRCCGEEGTWDAEEEAETDCAGGGGGGEQGSARRRAPGLGVRRDYVAWAGAAAAAAVSSATAGSNKNSSSSNSSSDGGSGDGADQLVAGDEALLLRPVAACALDVPEPACLAAVGLRAGALVRPAAAGPAPRAVTAVAGRGLQLVEGSW